MAKKEERRFDIRTIDRFTRDGDVPEEEYEKYLESLPDVSEKGVSMDAKFVHGVLVEDEEQ